MALIHALKYLKSDLYSDTRNVLLTYARIWSTLKTDAIRSKASAASWAIDRLPEQYQPIMKRAKAICSGEAIERWDDIQALLKGCAEYMENQINKQIVVVQLPDSTNKFIKLANSCN